MIVPVLPLSINQQRSIHFSQDFSFRCIKHFFLQSATMSTPRCHTIRRTLLVFYIILFSFAYVPLLTSLLGIGSSMRYWPVLFSIYRIFQFISLFGDACSSVDKFIYYFNRVSLFSFQCVYRTWILPLFLFYLH
jgi:hypothetical protein